MTPPSSATNWHPIPMRCVPGFYVGDVDGNPGKSLVVELDGPRRGLWKDFSTDEGGDVIDLWARSQGRSARSDFPRIAGEIRQWLGLAPPNITPMRRDVRSVPMDDLGAYTAKWDYLSPEGELIAALGCSCPHVARARP